MRKPWRPVLLAMALHILLVWIGAAGVRGSDQYWYVADVEALMRGEFTTNAVFAVNVWRGDPIPPPFIHNILNNYLVYPFASVFGSAYAGWILANLAASLLIAVLIVKFVLKAGYRWMAPLAATIWLLSPLTLWLTAQASAEATSALAAAAAIMAMAMARTPAGWLGAAIICGAAYWMRTFYLPAMLAAPALFFIWSKTIPRDRRAAFGSGMMVIAAVFVVLQPKLLPSAGPSLTEVIAIRSNVTGLMGGYTLWEYPSFDAGGMVRYATGELARFFLINSKEWLLFVLPALLLAGGAIAGRKRIITESMRRLGVLSILLALLILAVVSLHTNQPRFLLPLYPPLTILAVNSLPPRSRWKTGLIAGVWIIGCAAGGVMMYELRRSTIEESERWTRIASILQARIPEDENLLCSDLPGFAHGQAISYYLRPRIVGFYGADRTQFRNFIRYRDRIGARWLLDHSASATASLAGATLILSSLPPPFEDAALYRLP